MVPPRKRRGDPREKKSARRLRASSRVDSRQSRKEKSPRKKPTNTWHLCSFSTKQQPRCAPPQQALREIVKLLRMVECCSTVGARGQGVPGLDLLLMLPAATKMEAQFVTKSSLGFVYLLFLALAALTQTTTKPDLPNFHVSPQHHGGREKRVKLQRNSAPPPTTHVLRTSVIQVDFSSGDSYGAPSATSLSGTG